jgi:hypothetical protein
MPNIAYPPARPLSVGELLDLAFRIYRATIVRCIVLAGLGLLANQLWRIYALARGLPVLNLASMTKLLRDPGIFTLYLVGALAQAVLLSAVLLRQYRLISGPQSGDDVVTATRRLPAIIGLGLLVALACAACFLPLLVGGVLRPLFMLLAVGAVSYVAVSSLSGQAILLTERLGPLASFQRSWRLTHGSFWRLSLIYFIAALIVLAMYIGLGIVVAALAGILGRGDVAVMTASQAVLGVGLGALVLPFFTALSIAILGDLKVRKEGTDIEQRIAAAA